MESYGSWRCAITPSESTAAINLAGQSALHNSPDAYLREPGPPVLKDYFDPRLHKVVRLPPRVKHVRVNFSIEEVSIRAGGNDPSKPEARARRAPRRRFGLRFAEPFGLLSDRSYATGRGRGRVVIRLFHHHLIKFSLLGC